jgi:hypothetical protein
MFLMIKIQLFQDKHLIGNLQMISPKLVLSHPSEPTHLKPVWAGNGFVLLLMSFQPDPAKIVRGCLEYYFNSRVFWTKFRG